MTTQRIFTAIKIANTDQICMISQQLRSDLQQELIKWVDPKGLHLTLCFIGETDVRKIPMIKNRLKLVAEKTASFRIQLKSVGAFPDIKRAKVLWAGVEAHNTIYELQKEVVKQLKHIVPLNDSRFSPHLTLGRIKHGVKNPKSVEEVLRKYESWQDKELAIDEFVLMESILTKEGPIYKVVESFQLKHPEKLSLFR